MNYSYTKQTNNSFNQIIEKIKETLKTEGFGVLTEINVKETMKNKINEDYEEYVILGACNPQYAHKSLQAEYEIGLMLPCNIIVYEKNGKVFASAIMPSIAMNVVDNAELQETAMIIEKKLKNVIDLSVVEKLYECPLCHLKYSDTSLAEKCEKWCSEHKTCNLDIIKYAKK